MNRHQLHCVVLAWLGAGLAHGLAAQRLPVNSRGEHHGQDVRLAEAAGEPRLHALLHGPVLDRAGTSSGTVEDFLLDRTSGRLMFAFVYNADARGKERRRVVRADALQWRPPLATFAWDGTGEMTATDSAVLLQSEALVRATSLAGRIVRKGGQVLGRIADVVIDLPHQRAALELAVSPGVMNTGRTFVVGMSRLRLDAAATGIATTVTAEELARVELASQPIAADGALPSSRITGASGIAQSSVTGQTGYSSPQTAAAATTPPTDAGVMDEPRSAPAAAPAIRAAPDAPASPVVITPGVAPREADAELQARIERALAADPRFLGENLTVSVQRGVATLHGTVGTSLKRDAALALAREAGARVVKLEITARPPQ